MMPEGGVIATDVVAEASSHEIESPADWWFIIVGSGYRGTVDQLTPTERERVRELNISRFRDEEIREVEANVVYALATKN